MITDIHFTWINSKNVQNISFFCWFRRLRIYSVRAHSIFGWTLTDNEKGIFHSIIKYLSSFYQKYLYRSLPFRIHTWTLQFSTYNIICISIFNISPVIGIGMVLSRFFQNAFAVSMSLYQLNLDLFVYCYFYYFPKKIL